MQSSTIKLVTYQLKRGPRPRVGLVLPTGGVLPLSRIPVIKSVKSMLSLIDLGQSVMHQLQDYLRSPSLTNDGVVPVDKLVLLAPIPVPRRNVFCVGKNYKDHVNEIASVITSSGPSVNSPQQGSEHPLPVFFTKAPQCVVGPNAGVEAHDQLTKRLDWEIELAVIIGSKGRDIPKSEALSHVFGYTIANDITARDLQKAHNQWFKGKTLDTSCPLGPFIVPASCAIDPSNLEMRLLLNGVEKQHSNTSNMIHDIPTIISSLSQGFTLLPGDIILTGTPGGVGMARTPPEFLKKGDVLTLTVEGLGELTNNIV